jgi:hypothetical protein
MPIAAIPCPMRGVSRSSRTLGAGGGGRGGVVAQLRGRTRPARTAKSCGPDAPTLASSCAKFFARRRWQSSPVTGESTKETVKTIVQGMPGRFRRACGDDSCAFYLCTRGYGCGGHPAFPAPFLRVALRPLCRGSDDRATRANCAARTLAHGCLKFESEIIRSPRSSPALVKTFTPSRSRRLAAGPMA